MEQWLAAHTTIRNYQYDGKVLHKTFPRYGFIRYADGTPVQASN